MLLVSDYDKKMMAKTQKWLYIGEDGWSHLKEDAPIEIKKHHEKMRKLYAKYSAFM